MTREDEQQLFTVLRNAGIPEAKAMEIFLDLRKHEIATEAQHRIERDKIRLAQNSEMYNAIGAIGRDAVKAAMIMNGAASLGVLTLIGHLATNPVAKITIAQMSVPSLLFAAGVLSATCCYGVSFLSERSYRRQQWNKDAAADAGTPYEPDKDGDAKKAERLSGITRLLCIGSYLCFTIGGVWIFFALRTVGSVRVN